MLQGWGLVGWGLGLADGPSKHRGVLRYHYTVPTGKPQSSKMYIKKPYALGRQRLDEQSDRRLN